MFKKLRDKISEEVQQSSIRLPVSVQQLSQLSPFSGSGGENSEPSKSPQNEPQDELLVDISEIQPAGDNKDLFSIDEDSGESSPNKTPSNFQVVELGEEAVVQVSNNSQEEDLTSQHVNDPFDPSSLTSSVGRLRKGSDSSSVSEVTGLFPIYEVPGASFGIPQSDLESCSSEWEDNSASLDRLSKDTVYQGYLRVRQRYHKYKGRYSDIVRAYQEKEKETSKLRDVLTKTQDKAMRRVSELREQCSLEQQAKAHLEQELRSDLEERDHKISALQTKIRLLQEGSLNEANCKPPLLVNTQENEKHEDELVPPTQTEDINFGSSHSNEEGDNVSVGSLGSISTAPTSLEADELIDKLRGDIVKHKTLLGRCMENIRQNKEKLTSMSQERDQATKKLQEITDSMGVLKTDHEKELQSLKASVESSALSMAETKQQLFKEFQSKEVEADLFKQRAAELELTIKSLQEQLEDTKRECVDDEQEICIETKLENSETTSELSLSFRESELKCSELEKLVSELQDTTKNLEMKLEKFSNKNLSLEEALKNLKNKDLPNDSHRSKDEFNKLLDEKVQLEQTYTTELSDFNKTKLRCEELSVGLHNLKADYDKLTTENENLNAEMLRLSNSQAEKLQLNTDKINELIKENSRISAERDKLSEQVNEISMEKTDFTDTLTTLQKNLDEVKVQNDILRNNYSALQNDSLKKDEMNELVKRDLEAKSSGLERELKNLGESLKEQITDKDLYIISLEEKLRSMSDEFSTEKQSSVNLKSELQTLRNNCTETMTEFQKLTQSLKDKDDECGHLKTLHEEVVAKSSSMESSNKALQRDLDLIKDQLIAYSPNCSLDDEIINIITKSLMEKSELAQEVENLRKSIQDYKVELKESGDKLLKHSADEDKYRAISTKIKELKAIERTLKEEVESKNQLLSQQKERIKKSVQDHQKTLDDKEEELSTLRQELTNIESLHKESKLKLEEVSQNAHHLQKINAKMKASLEKQEERMGLASELEKKVSQLTEDKKEISSKLQSKISDQEKLLNSKSDEIKKLKKDHESQLEEFKKKLLKKDKELKAVTSNLTTDKSALQTKITTLQEEAATLHTVIEQNESFIASLKKEHEKIRLETREDLQQECSAKLESLQREHDAQLASVTEAHREEASAQLERESERLRGFLAQKDEAILQLKQKSESQLTHEMEQQEHKYQKEIQELKERLAEREKQLETQVQDMEVSNTDLKQRIESLQVEIGAIEKQFKEDSSQAKKQHEDEISNLQNRFESEKRSLEERLTSERVVLEEQLTTDKNALKESFASLQEEKNKLQKSLESTQVEKNEILSRESSLKDSSQGLENQIKSLREENERLAARLMETKEAFDAEKLSLQEEALSSKTALQELLTRQENGLSHAETQSVIASLTEQIDCLKGEQTAYRAQIQELQANCSETASKLNVTDQQKNVLRRNLEDLTSSEQNSGTDEAKLTEKLAELEEQIQSLKSENTLLTQELERHQTISSPESTTSQMDTVNTDSENLAVAELEQLKNSADKNLSEEKTKNETLRVECSFFKGEIERVRQSLIAEQLSSESLKQENAQLKEDLESSKRTGSDSFETNQEELASLSANAKSLTEENQSLRQNIGELNKNIQSKEEALKLLDQLKNEKNGLLADNSKLQETTANLQMGLNDTLLEKNRLSEDLNKSKQDASALSEQVSALSNFVADLQKKNEQLIQTSNHSASELASAQNKCSLLEDEVKQVSSTRENLQQQLQDAQSQSAALASKVEALLLENQSGEQITLLEKQIRDLQVSESSFKTALDSSKVEETSLRSTISTLEFSLNEEKNKVSYLDKILSDLRATCHTVCSSLTEKEDSSYFHDVLLALSHQRDEITKQLSEELISREQLSCQLKLEADKYNQINSSLKEKVEELEALSVKYKESEEKYRLLSLEKEEASIKIMEKIDLEGALKEKEISLNSKHKQELSSLEKSYQAKLSEAEELSKARVVEAVKRREDELQNKMDQLTEEWNHERKELERLTQVAAAAFKTGTDSVDLLKKQVASQRKEIEDMKHNHRKETNELQALLEVKRRRGKPAGPGGIRLTGALEDSAEFDYLRNILYQYMLGKETRTLCKVLCAVVKFDKDQQQQVLEFEERKQSLKRNEKSRHSNNAVGDHSDLTCLR